MRVGQGPGGDGFEVHVGELGFYWIHHRTLVVGSSDKAEWIRIIASTCSWSQSTILWFLRFRLRRRKRRRNSLHF
ncbi:hypothetical protein PS2_026007 [Malus domestica]